MIQNRIHRIDRMINDDLTGQLIQGLMAIGLLVNFGTPLVEYYRRHIKENPVNPVYPV